MNVAGNFLSLAISSLIPILAAAVGGMFAERARAGNIALDGTMLLAALASIVAAATTGSVWLGLIAGVVAGAAYGGVLAFAAYVLRCDLLIAGIAANLLATGLSLLIVQNVLNSPGTYSPAGVDLLPRVPLGSLADIPIAGGALQSQSVLLYLLVITVAVAWVTLQRTRFGLHVKAVGDADEAAAAVGIRPTLIRTVALVLSGAAAGLGGVYLSLSSVGSFNSNLTGGLGFIAFAAVIFGRATPLGVLGASSLFALATAASIQLQGTGTVDPQLLQIVPYVATVLALAAQSIRGRHHRRFDVDDTTFLPAIIPRG